MDDVRREMQQLRQARDEELMSGSGSSSRNVGVESNGALTPPNPAVDPAAQFSVMLFSRTSANHSHSIKSVQILAESTLVEAPACTFRTQCGATAHDVT